MAKALEDNVLQNYVKASTDEKQEKNPDEILQEGAGFEEDLRIELPDDSDQTPARAMSNHVQSFTSMSLQYHSGYFQRKKQPVRLMPWLSLRGDSPSSKIVSYISSSLLANSALSPVRNS